MKKLLIVVAAAVAGVLVYKRPRNPKPGRMSGASQPTRWTSRGARYGLVITSPDMGYD
ncbi:DLW-39 family protein [Arthrobacter sp. ISL-95]|uniref:DLW-39 family protein n=1 Tax=Arthrobacter sp. ISL-95 TaxID=2819116 RepID=UPI002852EED3|nr:DLW-39 family protein [Arthrobacter sp. ISL-95]